MAMGTRKKRQRQEDFWVVSSEVVDAPAHAFYDRLNQVLGGTTSTATWSTYAGVITKAVWVGPALRRESTLFAALGVLRRD